jgi:hypothetical protein
VPAATYDQIGYEDPAYAPPPPVEEPPPALPPAVASPPPQDSGPYTQLTGQGTASPPPQETAAPPPQDAGPYTQITGEGATPPPSEPVPGIGEAKDQLLGAVGGVKDALTSGDPGKILPAVGGVKDAAGTAVQSMGGDIFPYRRITTNKLAEMATQDIGYDSPGDIIYHLATDKGLLGSQGDAWTEAVRNDPKVQNAIANGYTDPATGTTFAPGNEAGWEAFVSDKDIKERAALDLLYDPSTLTIIEPGLSAAGDVGGKIPKAIAKGGRIIDDVLALGANQVIGKGLDVTSAALKKTGLLAPTTRQAATTLAEGVDEASNIFGTARREEGQLTPTTVREIQPGVFELGGGDPLVPPAIYKTSGGQITAVIDDPANLANARPLTMSDNQKFLDLMGRANSEDQAILMKAGGSQLLQPDATVAQPYLKALQAVLPSNAAGPVRGTIPVPTSGPELLALRSTLVQAATNRNTNAVNALTQAALRSNLLPASTPPTPRGVASAIGAIESARQGVPLIDPAVLTRVQGVLQANLNKVGLTDIGVSLGRAITNTVASGPSATIEGEYLNKVITLATDLTGTNNEDELVARLGDVMNHEVIHATRHLNLFKPIEWRTLSEMTRSSKMRGDALNFLEEVTQRYDKAFADGQIPTKLTPDQLQEEAVAEMWRAHMAGTLVATDVQKSLLEKITQFFRTVVQTLRGARPDQVLSNMESGRIGSRARPAAGGAAMLQPMPAIASDFRRGDSVNPRVSPDPKMAVPYDPTLNEADAASLARTLSRAVPWDEVPNDVAGPGWRTAQINPAQAQGMLDQLQARLLADPRYEAIARAINMSDGELVGSKLKDFIPFKARAGGSLLSFTDVDGAAKLAARDRFWYEKSALAMKQILDFSDEEMGRFLNGLAATSGGAQPKPNTRRTLAALGNIKAGRASKVPTRDYQTARDAFSRATQLGTDKFGNFSLTFKYLMGIEKMPPRATIDLQMAHLFGLPDNKILTVKGFGQNLYDFLADYSEGVRDILNHDLQPGELPWESWQVQAALWVDYRKASKIAAPGDYDDYARWLAHAQDEMVQEGIIAPGAKIRMEDLTDPKVEEMFGEAASFWRGAGEMTLETRSNLVPEGRVANANYRRLAEIDPKTIEMLGQTSRGRGTDLEKGQAKIDKLINSYQADQRKAFNKPGLQKFMRGVTNEPLSVSQLQTESVGTWDGQISPSLRQPLAAATGRRILDETEQARMVAWSSLAYDQEMGAATRFENVDLGQHNSFAVILPDTTKRSTEPQKRALEGFANQLGVDASAKQDFLGVVVDIHPGERLPNMEEIMAAAEQHLDRGFDVGDAEVLVKPTYSTGVILHGPSEYQPHIVDNLDESLDPIREALTKVKPGKLEQAGTLRETLDNVVERLRSDQAFDATSVDRAFKEINDAISGYNESPGAALGTTARKQFGNLMGGWDSTRASAKQRNRAFSTWNSNVESLLSDAEARAGFTPGPGAGRPPVDRHAQVLDSLRAKTSGKIETPVGSSYSVYRAKSYHGSSRKDLTVLTTDPPVRNFDFASSRMGVFMGADPATAMEWLPSRTGPIGEVERYRAAVDGYNQGIYKDPLIAAEAERAGKIYQADLTLNNAYDMTAPDMARFYEEATNTRYDENWDRIEGTELSDAGKEAQALKQRLIDAGHDGIVVWDVPTRSTIDWGKISDDELMAMDDEEINASALPFSPTEDLAKRGLIDPTTGEVTREATSGRYIREVISFKDVPVYSLKKGQFGVPPTKPGQPVVPHVYKRNSAQEFLGTVIADEDRAVLDTEYTFAGKTQKVWQRYVDEQNKVEGIRDIAIRKESGVAVSPKEEQQLQQFIDQLAKEQIPNAKPAEWSDEAVDRLASKRTRRFVEQATGLRDQYGEAIDPDYYKGIAGKTLKAYDNFSGFRRTMSLYSTTRGPAYVLMQAIGNSFTLAIADPRSLGYYSPIEQRRIVQSARGKGAEPYVYQLRDRIGLGRTSTLGASRDQLRLGENTGTKTFFENSTKPVVRGIGKIIAPQAVKENADAFDTLLRHAAWRGAFEPGYRTLVADLPQRAATTLAEFSARAGIPSPVRGDVFADAVRGLGSHFTGADLRKALVDAAPAGNPLVSRAAERISRDYVNDTRSLDKLALENVNRVGFSFDDTRADAVLSRVFMFHYWLSRASVLYLREAAANPYQAQLWSRATNAGNNQAKAGVPEWQKNMQEFMASPAGITGLWNPAYLVGTYLFFREDQEANPLNDLTKVGETLQTGFLSNLMLNPLLQGAIYVLGAGGTDFNPPDLLGTGKWTGDINTWLEKANRDVATFYATEKGNPKVVPNIDGRQLLSWVGEQITQRGWENDFFGMAPITAYDPNRSEQANMSWLVHDAILADNPALNDGIARVR